MTLPAIDKQAHFFSGIAIAAFLAPVMPLLLVMVVVFTLAILKEWWDSTGKGTPETLDAFATTFGGVVYVAYYGVLVLWG